MRGAAMSIFGERRMRRIVKYLINQYYSTAIA